MSNHAYEPRITYEHVVGAIQIRVQVRRASVARITGRAVVEARAHASAAREHRNELIAVATRGCQSLSLEKNRERASSSRPEGSVGNQVQSKQSLEPCR